MNTKLVYVLVSSEKDIYLEQAYVSMLSAKHHMPDAFISIIIDSVTKQSLTGIRKKEISIADEIIVVDLDQSYSAQKRSRLLKTSVRNHIQGDFLFIDCDTIIVQPLNEIDTIEADIAACWDSHTQFKINPYYKKCIEDARAFAWPIEEEDAYYNSGIIFCKDNNKTHEFYKKWNDNYQKGAQNKILMDQPSFAKTNYDYQHIIQKMPDIWNCELKHGMRYFKEAKIIHYLCTNENNGKMPPFLLNEKKVFLKIKESGSLPPNVQKLFDDPSTGIAPLTNLISGSDVLFFDDPLVFLLRTWYDNNRTLYKCLSCLAKNYMYVKFKIKTKLKKVIFHEK